MRPTSLRQQSLSGLALPRGSDAQNAQHLVSDLCRRRQQTVETTMNAKHSFQTAAVRSRIWDSFVATRSDAAPRDIAKRQQRGL